MHSADWIVLSFYLITTVGIGVFLGRKVKNTVFSECFQQHLFNPTVTGISAFRSCSASQVLLQLHQGVWFSVGEPTPPRR